MQNKTDTFTITVYFNGTSHEAKDDPAKTQHKAITLANYLCFAHDKQEQNQMKMQFSGCGITQKLIGTLFGTGLDEQANEVSIEVLEKLDKGKNVTLNLYGHSRGALAALLLIKQLKSIPPNRLSINLLMLDPVPGSLLSTAIFDLVGIYLPNKTMDLRDCLPLKNVFVLYPHKALPSIICHAPQFCLYPSSAKVQEIATPGCHSGAQSIFVDKVSFLKKQYKLYNDDPYPHSYIDFGSLNEFLCSVDHNVLISLYYSYQFLNTHGTQFKSEVFQIEHIKIVGNIVHKLGTFNLKDIPKEHLLKAYEEALSSHSLDPARYTGIRQAHSYEGQCIQTKHDKHKACKFFNPEHKELVKAITQNSPKKGNKDVLVTIEKRYTFLDAVRQFSFYHPITFKWGVVGMAIAIPLIFTGIFTPILSGSYALAFLAALPVVLMTLYITWRENGQSTTLIDKIAYPHLQKISFFEHSQNQEPEETHVTSSHAPRRDLLATSK